MSERQWQNWRSAVPTAQWSWHFPSALSAMREFHVDRCGCLYLALPNNYNLSSSAVTSGRSRLQGIRSFDQCKRFRPWPIPRFSALTSANVFVQNRYLCLLWSVAIFTTLFLTWKPTFVCFFLCLFVSCFYLSFFFSLCLSFFLCLSSCLSFFCILILFCSGPVCLWNFRCYFKSSNCRFCRHCALGMLVSKPDFFPS